MTTSTLTRDDLKLISRKASSMAKWAYVVGVFHASIAITGFLGIAGGYFTAASYYKGNLYNVVVTQESLDQVQIYQDKPKKFKSRAKYEPNKENINIDTFPYIPLN